jgi:hypothetical protein
MRQKERLPSSRMERNAKMIVGEDFADAQGRCDPALFLPPAIFLNWCE